MQFDPEAAKQQIRDLHKRGLSVKQIAEKTELHHTAVSRELYGHDHYLIQRRMVKLLDKGYSRREIANKLNVEYEFVLTVLSRAGRSGSEDRRMLSPGDREDALKMYMNGATAHEVGEKYDLAAQTVWNLASKHGAQKSGNEDWEKDAIAYRVLVKRQRMTTALQGLSMGRSTAVWYRFKDPITNPEFYRKHGITYDDIKHRYRFKGTTAEISRYWKVYVDVNENGMSYTDAQEKYAITRYKVRDSAQLGSVNAFVACWELALRRGQLPIGDNHTSDGGQ